MDGSIEDSSKPDLLLEEQSKKDELPAIEGWGPKKVNNLPKPRNCDQRRHTD
jgi:hypothetical protein